MRVWMVCWRAGYETLVRSSIHPSCQPAGSAAFCTLMPPPLTLEDIGPGDDCDHQNRSDILSFQKKLLSSFYSFMPHFQ